jgi:predicted ATP-binding protein involved in virulence
VKLTKLRLQNYRCFDALEIEFHEKLTVLIAPNGGGKTTLLDAARVALWPFVKGFDLGSQTGKAATIQIDDVRLALLNEGNMEPQTPCVIEAWGDWSVNERNKHWLQQRSSLKKGTNTTGDVAVKAMTSHGKALESQVRSDQQVTLPLVSYLGTSRLWFEGRFTSTAAETTLDKSEYSRTSGYLNCLSYSSSFKAFTAWYGWIYRSYREEQLIALEKKIELSEKGLRLFQIVEAIKVSIDTLIKRTTGWHSLEYSASYHQQLVMHHPVNGTLPVDMLSDGLRNAIAMVADLAFRACKLNPHLGARAPLETPGIVLIDEVDMFLHPQWQQAILGSLQESFTELQFIVTTHSPQVLSTVKSDCIKALFKDGQGQWQAHTPDQEILGMESSIALNDIMGVNPVPPVDEARLIADYTAAIENGQHETSDAMAMRKLLLAIYGAEHSVLRDADRLIRFQSFKLRQSSKVEGRD